MGRLKLTILCCLSTVSVWAQVKPADTTVLPQNKNNIIDTTLDYSSNLEDFEAFMDSILAPHSYLSVSVSAGKGYYNYESNNSALIKTVKRIMYSPQLAYYHKSGVSLSTTAYMVKDTSKFNYYQTAISPGYDFLENKNFAAGIAYTRFITKDSLPFYTTPLKNELYAYFTYRKWWFKPMAAVSFGWGSRKDFMKREIIIQDLRLRRQGFIIINSNETINDLSITLSVRHDFYWLQVLGKKDYVRISPQLAFVSGTQKFGLNQSSAVYASSSGGVSNLLNSDNIYLDDKIRFQPLSASFFLRTEYSLGKFYIQPVLIADYYIPASKDNFSFSFLFSTGFIF